MIKIHKQHKGLAAYKTAMKKARSGGQELTQEKAAEVAMATISALPKKDGSPIHLTDSQKDIVNALYYPTIGVRMGVLKETLESADSEMDSTMVGLLKPLLNPAALEKKLKAVENAESINWSEMVGDDEDEEETAPADSSTDSSEDAEAAPANETVPPPPVTTAGARAETKKGTGNK